MKRIFFSVLLALLLLLTLTACGSSVADNLYEPGGGAGSLIDLPVLEPEDVNQNAPEGNDMVDPNEAEGNEDVNQNVLEGNEDVNQNGSEGNEPGGKSDEGNKTVDEDGWYTSKEEVALYIHLYGDLPDNYVTKDEAEDAGWSGGNVERYTGKGTAIGGSRFGNREGLLPRARGRTYTECDIDTPGSNSRGAKRIVFSNDGLIYYTDDHYESFELLYGQP